MQTLQNRLEMLIDSDMTRGWYDKNINVKPILTNSFDVHILLSEILFCVASVSHFGRLQRSNTKISYAFMCGLPTIFWDQLYTEVSKT